MPSLPKNLSEMAVTVFCLAIVVTFINVYLFA
ncbi:Uncharacterised protein [Serratia odorifera]|jgi:hypothetical protein|uniref:Uncharacterized protein n=1 Tax=Serratia odorifera TaxID=618 RepID=A0A447KKL0_SEROD|nr:Uncharacterised protein [Serratia odorifera]